MSKYKEFDLEAVKKGAKVCTRDGRSVRIICWDVRDNRFPIVGLIDDITEGREVLECFTAEGRWSDRGESLSDLMIAPNKHRAWVRMNPAAEYVCTDTIYLTEAAALKNIPEGLIVAHIEWEE